MILAFYGLPLHIIRDLYITLRSFVERLRDMFLFRRAVANMNERWGFLAHFLTLLDIQMLRWRSWIRPIEHALYVERIWM